MKKHKKLIGSIGGGVALLVVYLFGAPHMFVSCGGTGDYALKRLRNCPPAVELLGDDIGVSWGISYGSTSTQGGLERANVRIPVSGSKGSGVYKYVADRVGDHIRFSGTVEVDGKKIDIGRCGGAGAALTGSGKLTGSVTSSTHPNVKSGSFCNGSMILRGTKKPAKLTVKCGGITIYDGEGTAEKPNDDTLTFTDDKNSTEDSSPRVSMIGRKGKADGDSGKLTVSDVKHGQQPAFEIVISL